MDVIGGPHSFWQLVGSPSWKHWIDSLTPENVEAKLEEVAIGQQEKRIIRDRIAGEIVVELLLTRTPEAKKLSEYSTTRAGIIYKLYVRDNFNYFYAKLRDRELAKEATQELWARVLEKIVKGEITKPYSFQGFIIETAKNLYRENIRGMIRRHKMILLEDLLDDEASDDLTRRTIADDLIDYLYETIETLPAKRKEVFLRYYFREQPCREIAAIMEIDVNTVKVHLMQARRALRQVLEDLGFDGSEFN